jgi:putative ABC transport system permease protein
MRNIIADQGGRFLNQDDVDQRRRVAFLGDELARLLFGNTPPVGEQVFVGEVPFTVIGVMRPKTQNSSYNGRDKDRIFIPATTHTALFGDRRVNNFVYRTSASEITKAVERQVYEVLGRRHTFDPTDEEALSLWDTSQWETEFNYVFLAFNIFFAIVGSFTLTVGGIGVANIMYIVVRERTMEIGVRRSVGATRRDILFQFIAETILIVAIGAVIGLLGSLGLVWALSNFPMQEFLGRPTISPLVMTVTLSLLTAIALLAGLFPAKKAASLDPVECLRY